MDVRLTRGPTPQRIAAAYRRGNAQLPGQIRRGFQRALTPLHAEIVRQAFSKLPDRYVEQDLEPDLHVQISLRGRGGAVTADARIYAAGKVERRKITDLERGMLRHPVYGRRRRRRWTTTKPRKRIPGGQLVPNPWVAQPVEPGFVADAVGATRSGIRREMDAVLTALEATLTGA